MAVADSTPCGGKTSAIKEHIKSEAAKKAMVVTYNTEVDEVNSCNANAHKEAVTKKIEDDFKKFDAELDAAKATTSCQKVTLEKAKVEAEVNHGKALKAALEGDMDDCSCKAVAAEKKADKEHAVHVEINAPTCIEGQIKKAVTA